MAVGGVAARHRRCCLLTSEERDRQLIAAPGSRVPVALDHAARRARAAARDLTNTSDTRSLTEMRGSRLAGVNCAARAARIIGGDGRRSNRKGGGILLKFGVLVLNLNVGPSIPHLPLLATLRATIRLFDTNKANKAEFISSAHCDSFGKRELELFGPLHAQTRRASHRAPVQHRHPRAAAGRRQPPQRRAPLRRTTATPEPHSPPITHHDRPHGQSTTHLDHRSRGRGARGPRHGASLHGLEGQAAPGIRVARRGAGVRVAARATHRVQTGFGLADIARHVIACRSTPKTRVQSV